MGSDNLLNSSGEFFQVKLARKNRPTKIIAVALLFFSLMAPALRSAEQQAATAALNADQIVERASLKSYYSGDDGRTLARMRIVDANGRKQSRQFTILRKDIEDGGEQKFLLVFSRPSEVKGTVFMVHKKPEDEDDRWLYLPALDLVKRISAGDKRTSFVGAHYFYEDVSGRSPNEDLHEIVSQNDSEYLLLHTPKEPESVEFSRYQTWIDKTSFLPKKIEYQDQNGQVYRRIEALKIEKVQGIDTVTQAKVTDLRDNSYTLMEFKRVSYDLGLPDGLFSERSLRNPPANWLKTR